MIDATTLAKQTCIYILLSILFIMIKSEDSGLIAVIIKCLPMLYITYLSTVYSHSYYQPYQTLSLLFGVFGDYTLGVDHGNLMLGAMFFFAGHLCALKIINMRYYTLNMTIAYVFGGPCVAITLFTAPAIIVHGGLIKLIGLTIYFATLTFMTVAAISAYLSNSKKSSMLRAIGFISFFISDSLISLLIYNPSLGATFTHVMITYYGAQLMIYLSSVVNY